MKKNNNYLKESLLDFDALSKTLKESTSDTVRTLLGEAVRDTYNKILTEGDDDEDSYEEEEVNDMDSEDSNDSEGNEETTTVTSETTDENGNTIESSEETTTVSDSEGEESDTDSDLDAMEPTGEEADIEEDGADAEEWGEFDDYKISDDTYDFSDAEDDDVVKVYKLLKDTDQVLVNVDKESNKVEIKDNETGNEYLIDLGGAEESGIIEDEEDDFGSEEDNLDMTNESRIFEIALNEYDSTSHEYQGNKYQKKDVMTNPGMSEPGKNVNDWDAGVPKGNAKPYGTRGSDAPFNAGKGKKVEEDEMPEEAIEEATNIGGFVQQNSNSKSHISNSNGRKARHSSKGGVYKDSSEPRYSSNETVGESTRRMLKAHQAIVKENKQLKEALSKFKSVLEEAAVTNLNLGQIVKLISENAVTNTEKKEIIARFGKEAKTVEQSKNLYESISRELKSNPKRNLNEEKSFTANSSKQINETQIYKSKDLLESLDLMHRLCK